MEASVGRVLIAKGVNVVTLTLAQWQLKQMATLTINEARELAQELLKCAARIEGDQLWAHTEDNSDLA